MESEYDSPESPGILTERRFSVGRCRTDQPSNTPAHRRDEMRTLAGTVLIAVAEQAFAHSLMVQFPNHLFASEVLLPSSGVLLFLGVSLMIWGVLTDFRRPAHSNTSTEANSPGAGL